MSQSATRYSSPLRDEQKAQTRQRILQAALRVLEKGQATDLSYAAIAEAAQVQERTVFRHFPSKPELFAALWHVFDEDMGPNVMVETEAEYIAAPQRVFPAFDRNEALMRALWTLPEGRAIRLALNDRRKSAVRKAGAAAVSGLNAEEARWLIAVAQLLYSGAAWSTMKDYWGFTGEEAGRASSFALELLFSAARARATTLQAKKGRKS